MRRYNILAIINAYDYRVVCLFMACVIYAVLGSPTPDSFGMKELMVGSFLVISIGVGQARDVLLQPVKNCFWRNAGRVFLIYGLSMPLIMGVVSGHNLSAIMRDIMPFLFLFLPIFLYELLRSKPHHFRLTLFAVLIIGFLFSGRSIMGITGGEQLYLENMPTVLFFALFMIGCAVSVIMKGVSLRTIAASSILIGLSLVPIMAMVMTLQRASLGAVALYITMIAGYFFYKSPVRVFVLSIVGVVVVLIVNIPFLTVFLSLWDKTQQVGLNMRPQEFQAVWDVISVSPLTFLFGTGWGGQFNSPAVGGLSVNFTHNFFSSVLLKAGAMGVILCVSYVAGLLEVLVRVTLRNPVLGFALSAPILIDLSLYASFKSLDFGLVLLMISGSLLYLRGNNEPESLQVIVNE